MRRVLTLIAIALTVRASATPALAAANPAAEAVCGRLLAADALAHDLGPGFAPVGFSDKDAGFWSCQWATATEPRARLMVRYNVEGSAKAGTRYDEHLAKMKGSGRPLEPVAGVGLAATAVPLGPSTILAVRAPDAFFSLMVYGMAGVSRAQLLVVARRLASVTPPMLDAARADLAGVRAREVPPPPAEEVVVRRNGQPLPCEQLVPRAEFTAIFGPSYRLASAKDPRPGVSLCEWKRTEQDYPITVRVAGEPEFTNEKMSAAAFFAFEVEPCKESGRVLEGIGEQARLCSSGDRDHTVIVRRAKDVIVLRCPDCSPEAALALAKAAVE